MSTMKKCADEWLCEPKYRAFTVQDPDGWDRLNFEASWAEEITEQEFNQRLINSTCTIRQGDRS
jgi:hypothetical protein